MYVKYYVLTIIPGFAIGDPSVVFAVLSLVVRDPAFAQEPYRRRYRCPEVSLDKDRVQALLPMLYQAKFDPNTSIADVS
jgi:hypothetical protein